MFLENCQQAYLTASNGTYDDGNRFFNSFFINFHDPYTLLNSGISLMNECYSSDSNAYSRIHKGAAFYYIGLAAFMLQDYEIASFFIDSAISEDIRAGADPFQNPSLAIRFINLDSSQQANQDFVLDIESRINAQVQIYNARIGAQNISITNLRNGFLQQSVTANHPNWRTLATAFISFCLEWNFRDMLFNLVPLQGTSEPHYLHLFKGCVLFESLLKQNGFHPWNPPRPNHNTLGNVLGNLYTSLNINQQISNQISAPDLNSILTDLGNEPPNESIEISIQYTGRLRNTIGHNLGWSTSLNKLEYQRLFQMVASSCLHAIACLYPP